MFIELVKITEDKLLELGFKGGLDYGYTKGDILVIKYPDVPTWSLYRTIGEEETFICRIVYMHQLSTLIQNQDKI